MKSNFSKNQTKERKNKMRKMIFVLSMVVLTLAFIGGCASAASSYSQGIRNETGENVTEIYIRNTGTLDWSSNRINRDVSNRSRLTLWRVYNVFEPPEIKNQDIKFRDNKGFWYSKFDVPIPYVKMSKTRSGMMSNYEGIIISPSDRHPILTISNRTGYPIRVTSPNSQSIGSGSNGRYQLPELDSDRNITVNFSINDYTFTRLANMSDGDTTITLTERPPELRIVNNTGFPIRILNPSGLITENTSYPIGHVNRLLREILMNNQAVIYTKQSRTANDINVAYLSSTSQYRESVTIHGDDVTLSLTRRPAVVTVQNNTGATIVNVQVRDSGDIGAWDSVNILSIQLNEDGTAVRRDIDNVTMYVTDLTGSIVTRDSFRFWMGNLDLRDGTYDIRVDDVHGMAYLKRNVQISSDIELNFTASDRL
ncbi:MAG: hypothetical protein FWG98_13325 [Candidatus Cloacimonetes bacterium]|nr:hypothetical protein [Candidatus Cloacimonadota bacterium]